MELRLSGSQLHQLIAFVEKKQHDDSIVLRPAPADTFGPGDLELVLIQGEDEEVDRRVLHLR